MQKFMFDTNAYNNLMDGVIDIETLPEAEYYCTFEQEDELKATNNEERRNKLLAFLKKLDHTDLPVETFVIGNARLDRTKLGDGKLKEQIFDFLELCKKQKSNLQDSLIAEVAGKNNLTLVTDDKCLLEACQKFKIQAIHLQDIVSSTHA